jgi:hypothetical protein
MVQDFLFHRVRFIFWNVEVREGEGEREREGDRKKERESGPTCWLDDARLSFSLSTGVDPTSLTRKRLALGPYIRNMPRDLRWS